MKSIRLIPIWLLHFPSFHSFGIMRFKQNFYNFVVPCLNIGLRKGPALSMHSVNFPSRRHQFYANIKSVSLKWIHFIQMVTYIKWICFYSRTTDIQWRHKSKISEKLGRCGRPKNLGVGVNFRSCSEGYFLSGRP